MRDSLAEHHATLRHQNVAIGGTGVTQQSE